MSSQLLVADLGCTFEHPTYLIRDPDLQSGMYVQAY